jgi:spermidine/putrescine-binding protein
MKVAKKSKKVSLSERENELIEASLRFYLASPHRDNEYIVDAVDLLDKLKEID